MTAGLIAAYKEGWEKLVCLLTMLTVDESNMIYSYCEGIIFVILTLPNPSVLVALCCHLSVAYFAYISHILQLPGTRPTIRTRG